MLLSVVGTGQSARQAGQVPEAANLIAERGETSIEAGSE